MSLYLRRRMHSPGLWRRMTEDLLGQSNSTRLGKGHPCSPQDVRCIYNRRGSISRDLLCCEFMSKWWKRVGRVGWIGHLELGHF